MILVANTLLRTPPSPLIRAMRVRRGFNVADREIVDQVQAGDLVVTADVPLAAEVIGRGAHALDPRGVLYTAENIPERLAVRNLMAELRTTGLPTGGPAPWSPGDTTRSRTSWTACSRSAGSPASDHPLILALGALCGGFVTGLAGFGTGLTALGLWLHVVSPAVAAALVVVCSVAGQIQSLYTVRRAVAWSRVWPFLVGGVLGRPARGAALRVIEPRTLKVFLGVLLVGYTGLTLALRRFPTVSAGGRARGRRRRLRRRGARRRGGPLRSPAHDLVRPPRLERRHAARRVPAVQPRDPRSRPLRLRGAGHPHAPGLGVRARLPPRHVPWRLPRHPALRAGERPAVPALVLWLLLASGIVLMVSNLDPQAR